MQGNANTSLDGNKATMQLAETIASALKKYCVDLPYNTYTIGKITKVYFNPENPQTKDKFYYDVLINGTTCKLKLTNKEYKVDDVVELEIPKGNWNNIRPSNNNTFPNMKVSKIVYGMAKDITEENLSIENATKTAIITTTYSCFEKPVQMRDKNGNFIYDIHGNLKYESNVVADIDKKYRVYTDNSDSVLAIEYPDSTKENPIVCKIIVEDGDESAT